MIYLKKINFSNISREYLDKELRALDQNEIPPYYTKQLVAENIIYEKKNRTWKN